jgi:DHA2 family multidrug resistance protein
MGISLANNVLAHREQFHQSRLVELADPASSQYHDALRHVTDYFMSQGSALLQAHQQAIQWIGQQVQAQAAFFAYMDVFWVLMLVALAAMLVALTLRKGKLGGPAPVGH